MDTKEEKVSYVWEKLCWAIDVEELVRIQGEAVGSQRAEQGGIAGTENGVVVGMHGILAWRCELWTDLALSAE